MRLGGAQADVRGLTVYFSCSAQSVSWRLVWKRREAVRESRKLLVNLGSSLRGRGKPYLHVLERPRFGYKSHKHSQVNLARSNESQEPLIRPLIQEVWHDYMGKLQYVAVVLTCQKTLTYQIRSWLFYCTVRCIRSPISQHSPGSLKPD